MGHGWVLSLLCSSCLGADKSRFSSQGWSQNLSGIAPSGKMACTALSVGLAHRWDGYIGSPIHPALHLIQKTNRHTNISLKHKDNIVLSILNLSQPHYCATLFPHLDFQLLSHHLISAPTKSSNTLKRKNHGAHYRGQASKHSTFRFSRSITCPHESWWI